MGMQALERRLERMVVGVFSRGSAHEPSARSSWAAGWCGRWTTSARSTSRVGVSCPTTSASSSARRTSTASPTSTRCCAPSSSRPPANTPAARATTSSVRSRVELRGRRGRAEAGALRRRRDAAPGRRRCAQAVDPRAAVGRARGAHRRHGHRRSPVRVRRSRSTTRTSAVVTPRSDPTASTTSWWISDRPTARWPTACAYTARPCSATATSSASARRTSGSRRRPTRQADHGTPIHHAYRPGSQHPQADPARTAVPLLRPGAVDGVAGGAQPIGASVPSHIANERSRDPPGTGAQPPKAKKGRHGRVARLVILEPKAAPRHVHAQQRDHDRA